MSSNRDPLSSFKRVESSKNQLAFDHEMALAREALSSEDITNILLHLKTAADWFLKGEVTPSDFDKPFLAVLHANPFEMKEDVVSFHEKLSNLDFSNENVRDFYVILFEKNLYGSAEEKKAQASLSLTYQIVLLHHLLFCFPSMGEHLRAHWDLYHALDAVIFSPESLVDSQIFISKLHAMQNDASLRFEYPTYFMVEVLKMIIQSPEEDAKKLIAQLAHPFIRPQLDVRALTREDKTQTLLRIAIQLFEKARQRFPFEMNALQFWGEGLQNALKLEKKEEKENAFFSFAQQFLKGLMDAIHQKDSKKILDNLRQLIEMKKNRTVESRWIDPDILTVFRYVDKLKSQPKLSDEDKALIEYKAQIDVVVVENTAPEIVVAYLPYLETEEGMHAAKQVLLSAYGLLDKRTHEAEVREDFLKLMKLKKDFWESRSIMPSYRMSALQFFAFHCTFKNPEATLFMRVYQPPSLFLCAAIVFLTQDIEKASQKFNLPETYLKSIHDQAISKLKESAKKPSDLASWYLHFLEEAKKAPDPRYEFSPEKAFSRSEVWGIELHKEVLPGIKVGLGLREEELHELRFIKPLNQGPAAGAQNR